MVPRSSQHRSTFVNQRRTEQLPRRSVGISRLAGAGALDLETIFREWRTQSPLDSSPALDPCTPIRIALLCSLCDHRVGSKLRRSYRLPDSRVHRAVGRELLLEYGPLLAHWHWRGRSDRWRVSLCHRCRGCGRVDGKYRPLGRDRHRASSNWHSETALGLRAAHSDTFMAGCP